MSVELLFKLGLGPWLMPVRGKIPVLDAWPDLPPVDEQRVRDWLSLNYNLGLRTGPKSGFVVIDNDQPRKPDGPQGFVLPPTGLRVRSPTGSTHGYYRHAGPWPQNSSSELAENVDVKSDGGYVALPPSIHPVAGQPYVFESTDEPGTLPADVLAILMRSKPTVTIDMRAVQPSGTGYAEAALLREAHAVRTASEGTRNSTLNRAAFNLGQLVAGGALDPDTVRTELESAAAICGLPESEAAHTISSGMGGGSKAPRKAPSKTVVKPSKPAPRVSPDVLVPGSHALPSGEYVEQGNHDFAASVLAALAPGALYRRSGAIGEISGDQFVAVGPERMRSIVDASVRLIAGKPPKDADSDPTIVFRTCSRDMASVVLEYASVMGKIRELRHISGHPVCVGDDFALASPGWNAETGVFLTCNIPVIALPLAEARAVLEDLICDFPFADPADRANYLGLMLTVILRPAIVEPVPMHLIGSPVERTGKTKLAEIVLGCGILGQPTPAMQIGVREEEREKRLTAALLAGDSVLHLDNLHDFVDSAALASLLTSSVYRGRELGHTRLLALVNGVTIIGTGNNVHATGEISKRVVPIILQPNTENPETRQDYRHPLLRAYVEAQRPRVIGALIGLVQHWRNSGRPLGSVAFGGFERWAAVVGGIMQCSGYVEWCSNLTGWRGTSDDFSGELRTFVGLWSELHSDWWVDVGELYNLAEKHELFSRKLSQTTERGRRTSFGQRVISAAANRVVGEWRIEVEGDGKRRRARLIRTS